MVQNYINTATQAGNFEDLVDFITGVSYKKTTFLSRAGRAKAKAIKHEWMTQALKAGASNARAEGYSPTFAAGNITARVRRSNQVQILALPFSASGTQDAVDKAGLGKTPEYENQKDLKFQELSLDLDFVLLNNTTVIRDADAGTAGEMDGLLAWATGAKAKGANKALLTEDLYNSVVQLLTDDGVDADTIFCRGFQRRAITRWSTPIRRMNDEQTYANTVNMYRGDNGDQAIVYDKHIDGASIVVCEMKYLKVAYLRPVEHVELGKVADERRGYVLTEATLEVLNPASVAKITNLAVAV